MIWCRENQEMHNVRYLEVSNQVRTLKVIWFVGDACVALPDGSRGSGPDPGVGLPHEGGAAVQTVHPAKHQPPQPDQHRDEPHHQAGHALLNTLCSNMKVCVHCIALMFSQLFIYFIT